MRWPWRRRRRSAPSEDARHALDQARRALIDTERMSCRVDEVADQLDAIRKRNHFADAVSRAIRGA